MTPCVERLDARNCPAVGIVGNDLVVTGTAGTDVLNVIQVSPDQVQVSDNGAVSVWTVPAGGHVIENGLGGNDNLKMTGSLSVEMHGGEGNDTLDGGSAADVLWGDGGSDLIQGNAGTDVLYGSAGRDRLSGDAGDDVVVGGEAVGFDFAASQAVGFTWAATHATDPAFVAAVVDATVDRLTGGLDADWFVANSFDNVTDFGSGADAWSVV